MVNKGLVEYIDNLVRRGYDINYLRSYLISYGYNQNEVDESIRFLYSQWQNQWKAYQQNSVQQQAYPQQVSPQQAFPQNNQQAFQGFPLSGNAFQGEQSHSHKKSFVLVFTILLIIIILASSGFLVYKNFFLGKELPKTLLDLDINLIKTEYYAGDSVEFVPNIRNMGGTNRFDIQLVSRIMKPDSGIALIKKDEFIAIETSYSGIHNLKLPMNIESGQYELNVYAKYGDKTANSSQTFFVASRPVDLPVDKCENNKLDEGEQKVDCGGSCKACSSCYDQIKNQGEVAIDCGGPCKACEPLPNKETCTDGVLNQDEVKIDCGGVCPTCPEETNPRKIIAEVKEIAASDPTRALELCKTLELEASKDDCFRIISSFSSQSSYCDFISSESKKDNCFMFFVMKGDYSLCGKIANPNLKQSCEALLQLNSQGQTPIMPAPEQAS